MVNANMVVARARIAGGISLEVEAPKEIQAKAGTPILIKFPFRFDDMSNKREDYEVELGVAVDNEPEETAIIVGKDHPVLSDDKRGFVSLERTIISAGQHTLHYRASVRLEVGGWEGGETQLQERSVEGTVAVNVR